MSSFLPAGTGLSLGDAIVTGHPLYTSATIWYCYFATGLDTNSGTDPDQPFKTVAAAYAAASAGDIIVLLDGHQETVTAVLTVAKAGLFIVGAGSASGNPTVKMTMNAAAASVFAVTAAGCVIANIWFNTNTQANSAAAVRSTAGGTTVRGCYFQLTNTDAAGGLELGTGSDDAQIRSCTFVATGTTIATQPPKALTVTATINRPRMDGVVLDGGAAGFSGNAFAATFAMTNALLENISALRGADLSLLSTSTGSAFVSTSSGASKVSGLV